MQFLKENKWFLYIVIILPAFLFYLDKDIISAVKNLRADDIVIFQALGPFNTIINFAGYGLTLIMGALTLCLIGKLYSQRLYETGRVLFIGLASAGVAVESIKHLAGRARPWLTDRLVFIGPSLKNGYDSFPSGHATLVFCFAYIVSRYFPNLRAVSYAMACLIGLERVEYMAHFPSDVIMGAALGILTGKIVSVYYGAVQTPWPPEISSANSASSPMSGSMIRR
ncbi:MAG: phosphatase PAP2 family protein [Desulfobacteraceae bacterium]|nr:phosphatase PAP2 family protein [Desulfobacteraceae bacterium]